MLAYYAVLALRSRHICFFSAANPGIIMGGNGLESKYDTIKKIPDAYKPKTVLAQRETSFSRVLEAMREKGIQFPVIAKPDVGYRGLLVEKLKSEVELETYLKQYPIDFIIQEYIAFEEEFGVLYYRFPDEEQGHITSITIKEFLHVLGDGVSTVRVLIEQKPRAILQMERLNEMYHHLMEYTPEKGEKVNLGEIGNHSKGTFFKNGNHLIDEQLVKTFDEISKNIEGFFYGRYDIRCTGIEDLKQGKNLKIIEINGVAAEPAHMYDPFTSSYFKALKEIARHWRIIQQVAVANHNRGIPYVKPSFVIRELRNLKHYSKLLSDNAERKVA